jgi:alpha-N-arabinofuranosidase
MTRLTRPLAACAVAFTLGAPILVQAQTKADPPITVRIDAGAKGPKVDRNIFGQFAEHLGTGVYGGVWVGKESSIPNTRGIRKDVVEALRAIKVPNVRWPGGCFADEYHWRHGIGPASARRKTINSNWGGSVEPNTFGTDEFMDFVDQIGSEAYVSVNIGAGTVARGRRLGRVHDGRSADHGGQGARRQRPSPRLTRSSTWASATKAGAAAAPCARNTMPTK